MDTTDFECKIVHDAAEPFLPLFLFTKYSCKCCSQILHRVLAIKKFITVTLEQKRCRARNNTRICICTFSSHIYFDISRFIFIPTFPFSLRNGFCFPLFPIFLTVEDAFELSDTVLDSASESVTVDMKTSLTPLIIIYNKQCNVKE